MHLLARNFSLQIENEVKKEGNEDFFGEFLKFQNIYHGRISNEDYVIIEEYIPGKFVKYLNSNGMICGSSDADD